MTRSLCRGLGLNTPAPKRSISKRPAPVAIISMAQHAGPNVMGHNADLRAQFTTGAAMSTVFAPTVRRIEFIIESTVVKTNPSSCSAINHFRLPIADCSVWDSGTAERSIGNRKLALGNPSRPLQRAFAPGVVVTDDQNRDKNKHLDEGKSCKGKVISHEDNRPRQQEDRFDVEDQEEHRDDVVTDGEPLVRFGRRIDAALVGPHLVLLVFDGTQKAAEDDRQDGKNYSYAEKNHDRPVSCDRTAGSWRGCGRNRLKKHHSCGEEPMN